MNAEFAYDKKSGIISRDCDSCLREPLVSCDWRRIDEDIMRLFGKSTDVSSLLRSAVIVPLLQISDKPAVLLVEKRKDLPKHGGQVAFPGGRKEPYDVGPVDTALREFAEETGLPSDVVCIVGMLEPEVTYTTGYVIVPIVGFIKNADILKQVRVDTNEITRIILFFLDEANRQDFKVETHTLSSGISLLYPEYELKGGLRIWGATARILLKILAYAEDFFQGALGSKWP